MGDNWIGRAACAGLDLSLFFPERGENDRDAKAVCEGCTVRRECREYAEATEVRWGVWGGTSERQRKAARRRERESA